MTEPVQDPGRVNELCKQRDEKLADRKSRAFRNPVSVEKVAQMSKLVDPHNRSRSNESYARRDEVSNKYTISYEHQRDLQTYHHDSRLDTSGGPISDRIRSPAMTHKTKNQQNDSVNHLMNHEEMAKQELLRQEYEAINDMAHFKNSQSQRGNYFSKGRVMSGTTNIE